MKTLQDIDVDSAEEVTTDVIANTGSTIPHIKNITTETESSTITKPFALEI
jgi:hypothetical protein